ncbi:unnamed protein product [Pleuronectes platessa]|uniref:Uncharacterized protein n=1 Tax=Pleuronectes platessa TaxID=8262 RepID=A0A9N7UMJ5_PLEPL|nr:unnamed protein product [Pleuronectes platessa]
MSRGMERGAGQRNQLSPSARLSGRSSTSAPLSHQFSSDCGPANEPQWRRGADWYFCESASEPGQVDGAEGGSAPHCPKPRCLKCRNQLPVKLKPSLQQL